MTAKTMGDLDDDVLDALSYRLSCVTEAYEDDQVVDHISHMFDDPEASIDEALARIGVLRSKLARLRSEIVAARGVQT